MLVLVLRCMFVFTNRCSLLRCGFIRVCYVNRKLKTGDEMKHLLNSMNAHIKHANENWKRKETKKNHPALYTQHSNSTSIYRLTLVNNFSFLFVCVCMCTYPFPSFIFSRSFCSTVRLLSRLYLTSSAHPAGLTIFYTHLSQRVPVLLSLCHAHSISTIFRSLLILPFPSRFPLIRAAAAAAARCGLTFTCSPWNTTDWLCVVFPSIIVWSCCYQIYLCVMYVICVCACV